MIVSSWENMRQHVYIRRQPRDTVQRGGGKPAVVCVFFQLHFTRRNGAGKAVHAQVKGGVVPLYGVQQLTYLHGEAQFLTQFAHHGILRAFRWLYLATGELPTTVVLVGWALGGKYSALGIINHRCYHLYRLALLCHAHPV